MWMSARYPKPLLRTHYLGILEMPIEHANSSLGGYPQGGWVIHIDSARRFWKQFIVLFWYSSKDQLPLSCNPTFTCKPDKESVSPSFLLTGSKNYRQYLINACQNSSSSNPTICFQISKEKVVVRNCFFSLIVLMSITIQLTCAVASGQEPESKSPDSTETKTNQLEIVNMALEA